MQNEEFGAYRPNQQSERKSYTADDLGYPPGGGGLLKNPIIATLILLVTAGIFAALILYIVPSKDDDVLPVVRADVSPYKTEPEERGGADIMNRDSTIFAEMGYEETDEPVIENLLRPADDAEPVRDNAEDVTKNVERNAIDAAEAAPKKPKALHPAGASPDTIAFVKSVLEQQEKEEAPTQAPVVDKQVVESKPVEKAEITVTEEINPAATHFVQLASVTDASGAEAEWTKLKSKFSVLSNAPHRVQRKDLGEKGIYYRIQAGPYSKEMAVNKCEALKAAGGSCFLVSQ